MNFHQADLGFATDIGKWFIQTLSKTRWFKEALHINGDVKLENVTIDTYSWADLQNAQISHGRLRFYQNNTEITGKVVGVHAQDVLIKGSNPELSFTHFKSKYKIWFNVKEMEWNIMINDTKYVTKDIKGNISGTLKKEPIVFETDEEANIYYSGLVTLITSKEEIIKHT